MSEQLDKSEILQGMLQSLNQLAQINDPEQEDLKSLFSLYQLHIEHVTDSVDINFTSLFTRLVFVGVKYNVPGKLLYLNHGFRKLNERDELDGDEISKAFSLGLYLMASNFELIHEMTVGFTPNVNVDDYLPARDNIAQSQFNRILRAALTDIREGHQGRVELICFTEENPHEAITVILESGEFGKQLLKVSSFTPLPFNISLVDVHHNEEGITAKAVVLEPDLLIGVTSVSECFQSSGFLALSYLGKKIFPIESNPYLLMGNAVNYILDELIYDHNLSFEAVAKNVFKLSPLYFSLMEDAELRDFMQKLSVHYKNLKALIQDRISDTGISKDKAYLEPSFYSNEYGLQGRLDLYHHNESVQQSDIVELKSGKLFKPNAYGLNENHYVQTLLYDLMLESVHQGKVKSNNYILYSALDEKNLRFAPRVRTKQIEALYVRNDIVFIEKLLAQGDIAKVDKMMSYLDPDRIPEGFNFFARDARQFKSYYTLLSDIEKSYFLQFLSFIGREYLLTKIGEHGVFNNNGLASLWLDSLTEKTENFKILSFLIIEGNNTAEENPILSLRFSDRSSPLSRFRIGDIAILYPYDGTDRSALNHQVFKSTIVELDDNSVKIRLRARQKNPELFEKYAYWHLESDTLDSGFVKQYNNLYEFIKSPLNYRRRILTLDPPGRISKTVEYSNQRMTSQQLAVLKKAIQAEDYFLLWGPPGTGKTSIMINGLTDYYFNHTNANILLLAYTNRAVDEICHSIDALVDKNYIRLGSRYATDSRFTDRLMVRHLDDCHTRDELKSLIRNKRVFTATVSSFFSNTDMLKLKQFDIVIIDEASQILEPMLVGLLSRFSKFILIGDHKQLPAVVAQDESQSANKDEDLSAQTGLLDLGNSLFERLLGQCIKHNWYWTYDTLYQQGRMHKDILNFISPRFYDNKLQLLEGVDRLVAPPQLHSKDAFSKLLVENRLIFIDTPIDDNVVSKTNDIEARMVSRLVHAWQGVFNSNGIEQGEMDIGVITPFRSQIALIKKYLEGGSNDRITVDTIERYQGGARRIVIISLAVSKAQLLDSISNISSEGIDRKLNVALTRAKEHVVILGSRKILEKSSIYSELISYCYDVSCADIEKISKIKE